MPTPITLFIVYLLGGITLFPFLVLLVLLYLSKHPTEKLTPPDDSSHKLDAKQPNGSPDGWDAQSTAQDPCVAACYFIVCREYDATVIAFRYQESLESRSTDDVPDSSSRHHTAYHSFFDRNNSQSPSKGSNKSATKQTRPQNLFFVVLRSRHLMLYDDAEQLEPRHVLALEHFEIDIFGGEESLAEGELFVRRNCLRLRRRASALGQPYSDPRPLFLFSDNCSQKEDFYLAVVQNQLRHCHQQTPHPMPLVFERDHMTKLVQLLHVPADNMQSRWINALVGRLFLAIYRSDHVERYVRSKIVRKLSRIQTPAFITDVRVGRIFMGESAPLITMPKLKELTIDGDLTVEADVRYRGNFSVEIMALARLDFGTRFRPREVNLRLLGICRALDGHVFIRIKPPPSNRIWLSFETMPKIDIALEPVVSRRQIKYGVVIRAIESRIRETFADTLVQPNWDDVPFTNTFGESLRGGLWQNSSIDSLSTNSHEDRVDSEHTYSQLLDGNEIEQEGEKPFPNTFQKVEPSDTCSLDASADHLPVSSLFAQPLQSSSDAPAVSTTVDLPSAGQLDTGAQRRSRSLARQDLHQTDSAALATSTELL